MMIGFSLIWIALWCVGGFVLGILQADYQGKMIKAVVENNLSSFWETMSHWKHYTVAHSHALCLGGVAFMIGVAMSVGAIQRLQEATAAFIISGVVLMGLGVLFNLEPLMTMASIFFIVGLFLAFIGLVL